MTDHVKAIKELAAATQNTQAMTGAAIVKAIHTIAAALEAHFDFEGVTEFHTDAAAATTQAA